MKKPPRRHRRPMKRRAILMEYDPNVAETYYKGQGKGKGKGKGKDDGRANTNDARAKAAAKAKAEAKAKAKAKAGAGRPGSRTPKKVATPGEEEAPTQRTHKTKLFCKTFAATGQCKNPETCDGINHWTQDKVDAAKSLHGENLQGWYNPATKIKT